MSKLKNIEAIQKMLQGTHRMQTKKTFYMAPDKDAQERQKSREEGEIWEERCLNTGKMEKWEKVGGIKRRHLSETEQSIAATRRILFSYYNCPKEKCTCMPTAMNEKMRRKTGMCLDCVIDTDTRLKIEGKFDDYALEKMRNNAVSYFKDLEQELEEKIKDLEENRIGYVLNADGLNEKWNVGDVEAIVNRLRLDLQEYKDMVLKNFTKKEEVVING